jgi:hypothetical protein
MKSGWEMRDTITIGTIAGLVATMVMSLFNFLIRLLGFEFINTWETAANIFLIPSLIHTPIGYFIGWVAQFILGSIFGLVVAFTLRVTGKDFYLLKGIGVGALVWMVSIGFFMRLLHIKIGGRSDLFTNLLAVVQFNIMGIITSTIVNKYGKFKKKSPLT